MQIIDGYTDAPNIYPEDIGEYNMALFGKGDVVFSVGERLGYTVVSNNQIDIKDGVFSTQGRRGVIKKGSVESCVIANGTQGQYRNDLIVIEYVKDGSTGYESHKLKVIKGTPGSMAADPAIKVGNIGGGDALHQMPLYRVTLNGLNIESVTQLFTFAGMPVYVNTMDDLRVLHDASNIGQIQFIDFSLDFCDVIFDIPFSQGQGYAKKMSEQYTDVFMFSGIKNLVTFRYDADARKIYSSHMITLSDDCVTIAPVDELPSDAAKNPKTLYVITE